MRSSTRRALGRSTHLALTSIRELKVTTLGLIPALSMQRSTLKAFSTASSLPHARMSTAYGVTFAWPTSKAAPHASICSSTSSPRSTSCACVHALMIVVKVCALGLTPCCSISPRSSCARSSCLPLPHASMSDVYVLTPGCSPACRMACRASKARVSCCALPQASMRMLYDTASGCSPHACMCPMTCSAACHCRFFLYEVMSRLNMTTSTGSPAWHIIASSTCASATRSCARRAWRSLRSSCLLGADMASFIARCCIWTTCSRVALSPRALGSGGVE
mmetsp:Transcript_17222/g.42847  ORF Transcript_17222/g.42847 Transcript_17222/m.42847 type:complete len:277 (+) Transcript_17222:1475-2305(+)